MKGFPIKECFDDNKEDILECYTTANLTKYLKVPMMIVESPYDSYSIENVVFTDCLTNKRPPFSMEDCGSGPRKVIEDYRGEVISALEKMRNGRKDVGLWAPSCAQHGFTDTDTFTDGNFRVGGLTVSEAIQQFLDNPERAPWLIDE